MSNPSNRNKAKNNNPQRPPTTSNRVERGNLTQGKIAVILGIKFNDNYVEIIINKKQNVVHVVSHTLRIK